MDKQSLALSFGNAVAAVEDLLYHFHTDAIYRIKKYL